MIHLKTTVLVLLTIPFIRMASAQQVIPLYDHKIPNSRPGPDQEIVKNANDSLHTAMGQISRPTLSVFLPPKGTANGTSVIVIPGGGYTHLAIGHEGYEIARRLNTMGITAFVLKYRLPDDSTMIHKETGPLQDAQRAIQIVRQQATRWKIDPTRIGLMGFSAGGHLASTAGTHFAQAYIDNPENTSLRPDFLILIYPVISFSDSIGHVGSRAHLLGPDPSPEKVREYSNELQVNTATPPTFLVHAEDDKTVPVQNSLVFYEALIHYKVPGELHCYPYGGHGFGLHNPTTKDQWADRLQNWIAGLFQTK